MYTSEVLLRPLDVSQTAERRLVYIYQWLGPMSCMRKTDSYNTFHLPLAGEFVIWRASRRVDVTPGLTKFRHPQNCHFSLTSCIRVVATV